MTDAISNTAANAANALKSAARTSEATNKAKLDTADAVETAATSPKVEPSTVELSPALAKEEYDNQLIKVRLGDFNHDKTALKGELL